MTLPVEVKPGMQTASSQPNFVARALPLGLALLLLACAGPRPPSTAGRPLALRVGISPDHPPMAFREGAELVGIEVEMAHAIGAELEREPEFVELEWPALIPALESGEIDVIMSGMAITPQREQRVLFTSPYLRTGQLALIRTGDIVQLGAPTAIRRAGARVGFERGSAGEQFVQRELRLAESYAFDSVEDALRSLRSARIDYLIHDAATVWRIALAPGEEGLTGLYRPLTEEHIAWAVARQNRDLRDQLNAVLDDWRARGRIEPVLDRWIPIRVHLKR